MDDFNKVGKAVAETTLRVIRLERILNYIVVNNPSLNLPSEQDYLDINLKAMEDLLIQLPGAKWVPEE